jgi:predicted nucleotidyltransferase
MTSVMRPRAGPLRPAIDNLYEIFAHYPLVQAMTVCDCGCVTPDDLARIASKPLRRLSAEDLERYAFKAITTWGEVHDFKHFLPRLLELAWEAGEVGHTAPETLIDKLAYGQWRTWPRAEVQGIESFFAALWKAMLRSSPESPRGRMWDLDTWLTALAQAVDDLTSFLAEWRGLRSEQSLRRLAGYLDAQYHDIMLYGRLGNPHWSDRQDQMRQVLTWLTAPQTREQLESGLAAARTRRAADAMLRGLDRWSRIPRAVPPARPETAGTEIDLYDVQRRVPYPLVFATVSGAHQYGFPSRDSDYDLRAAHVLPANEVLGLTPPRETIELTVTAAQGRVELVTHDVHKFFSLILKRNGYVLEQIYSPLVVMSSPEHVELKEIARRCITRGHADHYLGFAESQWRALGAKSPRIKVLLYVFRVLLTGIHLMKTGEVEASLPRLNEEFRLSYIDDLVAQKVAGEEDAVVGDARLEFFETEYLRLREALADAAAVAALPNTPDAVDELNDLLLRLRMQSLPGGQKHRRSSKRNGGSKRIERLTANVSGELAFLQNILKGLLGEDSDS